MISNFHVNFILEVYLIDLIVIFLHHNHTTLCKMYMEVNTVTVTLNAAFSKQLFPSRSEFSYHPLRTEKGFSKIFSSKRECC